MFFDGELIMVHISNYLQKDLDVYEMNVRAFTADESSELDPDIRGSYLGLIEKVQVLIVDTGFSSVTKYKQLTEMGYANGNRSKLDPAMM
ncbi:hypothetical protein Patl1_30180 [Pistacia atlantica]|uniref:Uncharacterized protein n=1 Tax=Pistacia atlantica TaxID=434234 RepID=A0ACC1AEQ4_9ROSI|nr:hypothetical protein Patl1_30180 [Pistacia atlantica]